jgi:hypothetical protein
MNESTIVIIAEAVLSNIRVLEKLIDALPVEVKAAVHEKVVNVAPVVAVAPAPAPVVAAPAMPAPPVFTQSAPIPVVPVTVTPTPVVNAAPAPVVASPSEKAPFADAKGLIDFVMASYKALGPQKGSGIQGVLTQLGYSNINDVNPTHYDALFAGIKALA